MDWSSGSATRNDRLTTAAFEFTKPRRWTWGVIDASYHVLALLITGVILALWR